MQIESTGSSLNSFRVQGVNRGRALRRHKRRYARMLLRTAAARRRVARSCAASEPNAGRWPYQRVGRGPIAGSWSRFPAGSLGSGTWRDLLDGPPIAVRIAEIDEGAPGLHVDVADLDPAPDEFGARGVYVRDHQLETPDRPRPHVGDAGADRDRAGRSGRRQLDESKPLSHRDVDVGVEAGPLGIEGLGAVDVGYGDGYQFKMKVHGPIV